MFPMLNASVQRQQARLSLSRHASAGFSLLEVLIAGTIFALGLAGFSALLLSSVIGSAQARREGFASTAAVNLAEQIRMNPGSLERYLHPVEYVSKICNGDASCSPAQQADYDFRLWQLELSDRIPGALGIVCRDQTPEDGDGINSNCDGSGPLVIKIFWEGRTDGESQTPVQKRVVLRLY